MTSGTAAFGQWAAVLMLGAGFILGGCGAISGADDLALGSKRTPEPVEHLFLALATDIWSEKPCYLIHPGSLRVAGFNSPGTQVSYLRSTCFRDVAEATSNPALCDNVRSVSTLVFSGAGMDRDACVRSTSGHSAVSRRLDMPAVLELAGYDAGDVDAALVSAGRFPDAARAMHFREHHPGIYWNEVRQYVVASQAFFERIETLPGFASAQDLAAMRQVDWKPRFKRDLPLPEQRIDPDSGPEFRVDLELDAADAGPGDADRSLPRGD